MANEFKHGSVGTQLTQAEWEGVGTHVLTSQATGDIIYASSSSQLTRLGIGSSGQVLKVSGGVPTWGTDTTNVAASALTGTTMAANVVTSSLTTVGTLINLTVTNTITGSVSGSAATATTATNITAAANATNADQYVSFLDNASTSAQQVLYDAGLVYNPSSNTLTTTTFVGALTGNVTGNASGTAATVTGAAQSAITSVGTLTALTGGTGDFIWDTDTLVVDSSADAVGIGTTSPSSWHANADDLVVYSTGNTGITLATNDQSTGRGALYFSDGTSSDAEKYAGYILYTHSDNTMYFGTNGNGTAAFYVNSSYNMFLGNHYLYDVGHADSVWDSAGLRVGGTYGWMIGGSAGIPRVAYTSGTSTFGFLNAANAWANLEIAALQVNGAISMYNSGTLSLTGPVSVTTGNMTVANGTLYVDSGSTNTVAKFESSDGDAHVQILDSDSDGSNPPGFLADANDLYVRGGTSTAWGLGVKFQSDGHTKFYGNTYHSNAYIYDVGHADSYWTNDGAKFASDNVGVKVYISSATANSYPSIRMVNDVQEWRIYAPDGSITGDAFHVYDATDSKYRLTVGSSGEIGFNTPTFDSWITTAGSGYTPVFLGSKQSSIHGTNYDSTGSWTGWQQNAYLDSTNSRWEYVTTGTGATNIYQYNGNIYFRVAASGTADNAITWSILQTMNTTGISFNNYGIYDAGNANSHWDSNGLQIGIGNVTLYSGHMITISNANAGAAQKIHMNNSSTAAESSSTIEIYVDGTAETSDPSVLFATTQGTNIYWAMGIDRSNSKSFAISQSSSGDTGVGRLGTNDALRITAATPPVTTYNTTHPTGTFDYVCESCGRHEAEQFECCGKVEWHDDVIDYRGMALRNPDAINYMEKIGVIERTTDIEGKPEVFTVLGRDFEFAMSAAFQNRQRMDSQYDKMVEKINRLEKELEEVRNGI